MKKALRNLIDKITVGDVDSFEVGRYYEIDKVALYIQSLRNELHELQNILQNERKKTEYLLSSMSEGFVILDNQRNILFCNNSAYKFFTCKNSPETIYNLTRNKNLLDAVQSALDGHSSTFEVKLKKRVVNAYIRPSRAPDTPGVTMLLIDITSEKRLKVQKRDLFSNASHELKTPITSIIGFSEMLNKDMIKDENEKKTTTQRIETEAKRMSVLIDDMLTISQLETNKRRELTSFDFSKVAREAINTLLPRTTDIKINDNLENIQCYADKHQIYNLCVNLIDNAIKYNIPSGNVKVTLIKKDGCAVFSVSDTGIGISLENQSRVFERFFRAEHSRRIAGTGLGLSIVKHIVVIHNGEISLKSNERSGTTIAVKLPILTE